MTETDMAIDIIKQGGPIVGALLLGGFITFKYGKRANGTNTHQHPDIVLKTDCDRHHTDLKEWIAAKLEAGNARMKGIENVGKANNRYLEELTKRRRNDRQPPKNPA